MHRFSKFRALSTRDRQAQPPRSNIQDKLNGWEGRMEWIGMERLKEGDVRESFADFPRSLDFPLEKSLYILYDGS